MIRTIISDLGNVLLHFDHRIIAARLQHDFPSSHWDEEQEALFWALVKSFERGAVDERAFLASCGELLGVGSALDEEHFRRLWCDIFWLNEEYLELLRSLGDRLTLVLLSNTNPLHIAWAEKQFPEVFALFPHRVYSYEERTAKPDTRIYRAALTAAGSAPEETLYFDDIAAYADAATALGMKGHQYVSAAGVRDVLALHGFPVPSIH